MMNQAIKMTGVQELSREINEVRKGKILILNLKLMKKMERRKVLKKKTMMTKGNGMNSAMFVERKAK